ncbi:MAG: phosphodiester glycosidase family protein [Anaerolineales bacterium]|jgi:hypothetical protein|nr:phosphodiester glycosidase family protein [Anaerolineales bacterium]
MLKKSLLLILLGLLLLAGLIPSFVSAASNHRSAPEGYELIRAEQGVSFYRKEFSGGSPDFVQVADLSRGAQVILLHGDIAKAGRGDGVYGGDNAYFQRLSIRQFWKQFETSVEGAFCVSNGQFFRLADSPTPLPFPLKVGGQILTDGYGIKEFPEQKLMLEIWSDRLDIRPLSMENLYGSDAPNIVAGLTEDAEKASKKAVGRTFIGIADQDGDRRFETFFIFNTRVSKPEDAADSLRAFGASKVMMLDGGGSTQLACADQVYIDSERLIPQAIGIAAGYLPELSAIFRPPPEIPLLLDDSAGHMEIELENRGAQTWEAYHARLYIRTPAQNLAELPLERQVRAGEVARFDWRLSESPGVGYFQASLAVEIDSQASQVEAGVVEWVVIPAGLANRAPDLQARLATWREDASINLREAVNGWLEEEQRRLIYGVGGASLDPANPLTAAPLSLAKPPADLQVNLANVAWIPLLMIPVALILRLVILRIQRLSDL